MVKRRGMGKGRGKGFKNILPTDPRIHSESAKGRKQRQFITVITDRPRGKGVPVKLEDVVEHGKFLETFDVATFHGTKKAGHGWSVLYNGRFYRIEREKEGQGTFFAVFKPSKSKLQKYKGQMNKAEKILVSQRMKAKDTDGDGVANIFDCDPLDPNKQDKVNIGMTVINDVLEAQGGKGRGVVQKVDESTNEALVLYEGDEKPAWTDAKLLKPENGKKRLKAIGRFIKGKGIKGLETARETLRETIDEERRGVKAEQELDTPEFKRFKKQRERVFELKRQHDIETDQEEKDKIKQEMDEEEAQLNEALEKITHKNIEEYSDAQLKQLAVRKIDRGGILAGMFETENKFEKELFKRARKRAELNRTELKMKSEERIARKKLEKELKEAEKEAIEKKGFFEDLF